jgi:hypothetical protein
MSAERLLASESLCSVCAATPPSRNRAELRFPCCTASCVQWQHVKRVRNAAGQREAPSDDRGAPELSVLVASPVAFEAMGGCLGAVPVAAAIPTAVAGATTTDIEASSAATGGDGDRRSKLLCVLQPHVARYTMVQVREGP